MVDDFKTDQLRAGRPKLIFAAMFQERAITVVEKPPLLIASTLARASP